ncbi:MAG TPA: hypothetical protein IGS53_17150 [Leptolyngbyaceae cyanobacterium M33_DOE_097]|uniref:Uncharacterized protein n=1 Tax=Oscillatoriales cyanobacterium SpSt-418 TaxID=2282169 RepID=A0A7C3PHB4_9CYAN|nr:hypothetical protein [Leptolyngbyaceae cyanobacterium M33_DOE_097]
MDKTFKKGFTKIVGLYLITKQLFNDFLAPCEFMLREKIKEHGQLSCCTGLAMPVQALAGRGYVC